MSDSERILVKWTDERGFARAYAAGPRAESEAVRERARAELGAYCAKQFDERRDPAGYREVIEPVWPEPDYGGEEPADEELRRMVIEGVADATDGCIVEPDGVCAHGHPSWLLYLGVI